MTSPLRGPAPHPQGRGSGGRPQASRSESGHTERLPQSGVQPPEVHPSLSGPQGEEALRAALAAAGVSRSAVRYRGFVLLPQPDLGWLVRPERSPMTVLPFRTPPISLSDVKALVDWRLDGAPLTSKPKPQPRLRR